MSKDVQEPVSAQLRDFKVVMPDKVVRTIQGKPTKLKGYSKLSFFVFKIGKHWFVAEQITGEIVHDRENCTTETQAKSHAKGYLAEHSKGDMNIILKQIASKPAINQPV